MALSDYKRVLVPDMGVEHRADIPAAEEWLRRARDASSPAALVALDARPWDEQKAAVRSMFEALGRGLRKANLRPTSVPAFRDAFAEYYGATDNTLDDTVAPARPVRARTIRASETQGVARGVWYRRVRPVLARAGREEGDLCGFAARISLSNDATVVVSCFDGIGARGGAECDMTPAFGRYNTCYRWRPAPRDARGFVVLENPECAAYNWQTGAVDTSPSGVGCAAARVSPPLRWFPEFVHRVASAILSRGVVGTIRDAYAYAAAANLAMAAREGVEGAAALAERAEAMKDAVLNNRGLPPDTAAITLGVMSATFGVAAAASGPFAPIVAAVGAAITTLVQIVGRFVPIATGAVTDRFGRAVPFVEVPTFSRAPGAAPAEDAPDPPGWTRPRAALIPAEMRARAFREERALDCTAWRNQTRDEKVIALGDDPDPEAVIRVLDAECDPLAIGKEWLGRTVGRDQTEAEQCRAWSDLDDGEKAATGLDADVIAALDEWCRAVALNRERAAALALEFPPADLLARMRAPGASADGVTCEQYAALPPAVRHSMLIEARQALGGYGATPAQRAAMDEHCGVAGAAPPGGGRRPIPVLIPDIILTPPGDTSMPGEFDSAYLGASLPGAAPTRDPIPVPPGPLALRVVFRNTGTMPWLATGIQLSARAVVNGRDLGEMLVPLAVGVGPSAAGTFDVAGVAPDEGEAVVTWRLVRLTVSGPLPFGATGTTRVLARASAPGTSGEWNAVVTAAPEAVQADVGGAASARVVVRNAGTRAWEGTGVGLVGAWSDGRAPLLVALPAGGVAPGAEGAFAVSVPVGDAAGLATVAWVMARVEGDRVVPFGDSRSTRVRAGATPAYDAAFGDVIGPRDAPGEPLEGRIAQPMELRIVVTNTGSRAWTRDDRVALQRVTPTEEHPVPAAGVAPGASHTFVVTVYPGAAGEGAWQWQMARAGVAFGPALSTPYRVASGRRWLRWVGGAALALGLGFVGYEATRD